LKSRTGKLFYDSNGNAAGGWLSTWRHQRGPLRHLNAIPDRRRVQKRRRRASWSPWKRSASRSTPTSTRPATGPPGS